jgi:hypothetical protein
MTLQLAPGVDLRCCTVRFAPGVRMTLQLAPGVDILIVLGGGV